MSTPLLSRVLVVINPTAGSRRRRRTLKPILDHLQSSAHYVEVVYTTSALDATRIIREKRLGSGNSPNQSAKEAWSLILCAGGDGTINEVMNGMLEDGADRPPPLAILPIGTGNGLAREIGLPLNPWKAYKAILSGAPRPIYLGKVDHPYERGYRRRYFILMAGVGFDAYVTRWVERRGGIFRSLPKLWVYLFFGFVALFSYPYPTLSFRVDGASYRGSTGIIAKAGLVAGPFFVFSKKTAITSPSLTLCLFKSKGAMGYLWTLIRFMFSKRAGNGIEYIEGKRIEAPASSASIQADGEEIGSPPAVFTLSEKPLHLIYPRSSPGSSERIAFAPASGGTGD